MISILIPVFNGAEWLREAIESALRQGASCIEVIIVDDGSTDNSLEIARSYQKENRNIRVVSQVNKGLASARNTGIMRAIGNYCLFLDADDILMDNACERIEQVIKETQADIVAPSFKEFGMSDREVILRNPTLEDFKTGNRVGYCQAIKTQVLRDVGGYSPRMTWGAEDLHLTINLLTRGYKLVTIPEVLWLYRTKPESMWTETAKHQEEFMSQIKKDFPLW